MYEVAFPNLMLFLNDLAIVLLLLLLLLLQWLIIIIIIILFHFCMIYADLKRHLSYWVFLDFVNPDLSALNNY